MGNEMKILTQATNVDSHENTSRQQLDRTLAILPASISKIKSESKAKKESTFEAKLKFTLKLKAKAKPKAEPKSTPISKQKQNQNLNQTLPNPNPNPSLTQVKLMNLKKIETAKSRPHKKIL